MCKDGTLYYLLGDHLGSTSLTTNASGNVISELRYTAWGEVRYNSGVPPTDYTYTGQYSHTADFGLMFYNARWYDPALGRFAQADSIVPGGVQGLDRYAYVNNNPVRYTDPSGHACVEGTSYCVNTSTGQSSGSMTSYYNETYSGTNTNKGSGRSMGDEFQDLLPNASGNTLEFNIIAGIPIENIEHATIGLFYLSLGVVTDEAGGVQFYYTTLNQKYTPGSKGQMGGISSKSGEQNSAYGLGFSLSRGIIFGDDFRTSKFLGEGEAFSVGTFPIPISAGYFEPRDKRLNYKGIELGGGPGWSIGHVSTYTHDKGGRIELPPNLVPICHMMGQCGVISSIPPIP